MATRNKVSFCLRIFARIWDSLVVEKEPEKEGDIEHK